MDDRARLAPTRHRRDAFITMLVYLALSLPPTIVSRLGIVGAVWILVLFPGSAWVGARRGSAPVGPGS